VTFVNEVSAVVSTSSEFSFKSQRVRFKAETMARTKQPIQEVAKVAKPGFASTRLSPPRPTPLLKLSHAIWKRLGSHICPNHNIPKALTLELNGFVSDILMQLAHQARDIQGPKRATMGAMHMQSAARLILPGELAKHAMSEGTKAVCKSSMGDKKAGLTFPATKVHAALKKMNISSRIGKATSVYLAATLEYLSAEVLELAAKALGSWPSRHKRDKGIKIFYLCQAVRNDEELAKLGDRIAFTSAPLFQASGQRPTVQDVIDTSANPTTFKRPFAKAAFTRVVREISATSKFGLRFRAAALEKLQVAAEAHLVQFIQQKNGTASGFKNPQPSAAASGPYGFAGFGHPPTAKAKLAIPKVAKKTTAKKTPAMKKATASTFVACKMCGVTGGHVPNCGIQAAWGVN
jgi:histone H3/H4